MKRYEHEYEAVRWYQEESFFAPVECPADGTKLVAELSPIKTVNLACPCCGRATSEIPLHVFKLYGEFLNFPTNAQLEEAKELSILFGREVPKSVRTSAMRIRNYIKVMRGKALDAGHVCSK